jgi:hypothetical protein
MSLSDYKFVKGKPETRLAYFFFSTTRKPKSQVEMVGYSCLLSISSVLKEIVTLK